MIKFCQERDMSGVFREFFRFQNNKNLLLGSESNESALESFFFLFKLIRCVAYYDQH